MLSGEKMPWRKTSLLIYFLFVNKMLWQLQINFILKYVLLFVLIVHVAVEGEGVFNVFLNTSMLGSHFLLQWLWSLGLINIRISLQYLFCSHIECDNMQPQQHDMYRRDWRQLNDISDKSHKPVPSHYNQQDHKDKQGSLASVQSCSSSQRVRKAQEQYLIFQVRCICSANLRILISAKRSQQTMMFRHWANCKTIYTNLKVA